MTVMRCTMHNAQRRYVLENDKKSEYENEPIIVFLIRDPNSIEVKQLSFHSRAAIAQESSSLISFSNPLSISFRDQCFIQIKPP